MTLKKISTALLGLIILSTIFVTSTQLRPAYAVVGDVISTVDLSAIINAADVFCSVGLAFDGTNLYVDACGDSNIYKVSTAGALVDTFDTGISELPNALAFDSTRNGLWMGAQSCFTDGDGIRNMPIYFWDFDDNSVTQMFAIPETLINPATGEDFLLLCFNDGLAFNANNAADPSDDELWFSDDVNQNIGVFRADGTFVAGYDASSVDPSLADSPDGNGNSGLAIGGQDLYLGNNGGGDVFRADKNSDPLALIDQFVSGNDRQEDMECDPNTFAPTEVMWVRTTPQGGVFPNVATAYEIEAGSCGVGGGEPTTKFMTGGGSVFTESSVRVTHGFELQCDATQEPNNLEVNWSKNKFHLESLTSAVCSDDPNIEENPPIAGFDTYEGSGTGSYNGISGATATWTIKDAGEPGVNDSFDITITDSDANVVLSVSGNLQKGNHQAHPE